uniref:hypothetical protein n=1 Tax=Pararhizobium sp. IMCC3301 TaxID=3067904 RepID=UPI002741532C|nr:hypothetical protein [Pararhizobium sp. IMCC3301]
MGSAVITTDLERLRDALEFVAKLVVADPVYAPIFVRLENEIADEEALIAGDVVARARAVARQNATR